MTPEQPSDSGEEWATGRLRMRAVLRPRGCAAGHGRTTKTVFPGRRGAGGGP
jgi:hypothetical protein